MINRFWKFLIAYTVTGDDVLLSWPKWNGQKQEVAFWFGPKIESFKKEKNNNSWNYTWIRIQNTITHPKLKWHLQKYFLDNYPTPFVNVPIINMQNILPTLLVGVDLRSYFLNILSNNRSASVLLLLQRKIKGIL